MTGKFLSQSLVCFRAGENDPKNSFQAELNALLQDRGDYLSGLVMSIGVPPEAQKDVGELSHWALDQAIIVYQAATGAGANNFFLLHGVTSAWALTKVVPLLKAEEAAEAMFYFLVALLAVYVQQRSPELDPKRLEEDEESAKTTWEDVRRKALSLDIKTTDEHVYKLVQVCVERKGGRSLVPDMGRICRRAAVTAVGGQFSLTRTP